VFAENQQSQQLPPTFRSSVAPFPPSVIRMRGISFGGGAEGLPVSSLRKEFDRKVCGVLCYSRRQRLGCHMKSVSAVDRPSSARIERRKPMPYEPEKDKVLKQWKNDETGLVVSINRYGDGEPKVQIGPRVLLKKDGSERAPVKAGRLSIEDLLWLYEIIDEVREELTALARPA
jgi:hypothetical protein